MSNKFETAIERIKTISMVICIGAAVGLYSLNFREAYAAWLSAKIVPFIGIPLLILFYLSLPFGAWGALKMIADEWSNFRGLLKDLKELKNKKEEK